MQCHDLSFVDLMAETALDMGQVALWVFLKTVCSDFAGKVNLHDQHISLLGDVLSDSCIL